MCEIVENFEVYFSPDGRMLLHKVRADFEGATLTTPQQAKEVLWRCFAGCKAKNIILNSGLQKICNEALYCCDNLKRIWIPASVQQVEPDGLTWSTMRGTAPDLFFETEPQPHWRQEYDEDVCAPDPYLFHRGGGDEYIRVGTRHVVKEYKSPLSKVYTHVSREQFQALCDEDTMKDD